MAKGKVLSTGSKTFVKGGSNKMFGKQSAGPMSPGVTGKVNKGNGGKFPMGGSTKMFGKQTSKASKAC